MNDSRPVRRSASANLPVAGAHPVLIRKAVTDLVRNSSALGREMRRKDAVAIVRTWIEAGTFAVELDRLERLMKQPPSPLRNRAKHTSGGSS